MDSMATLGGHVFFLDFMVNGMKKNNFCEGELHGISMGNLMGFNEIRKLYRYMLYIACIYIYIYTHYYPHNLQTERQSILYIDYQDMYTLDSSDANICVSF